MSDIKCISIQRASKEYGVPIEKFLINTPYQIDSIDGKEAVVYVKDGQLMPRTAVDDIDTHVAQCKALIDYLPEYLTEDDE